MDTHPHTPTIYGHKQAGENAFALLEAVSQIRRQSGWVELHKTIPSGNRKPDGSDYWPVYKVVLAPHYWEEIRQEHMDEIYAVAQRFGCRVMFRSRVERGHSRFIAVIENRG